MQILSFFTGMIFSYTHAWEVLLCLLIACWFTHSPQGFFWCGIGFIWATMHQHLVIANQLPHQMVLVHMQLEGVVSTIPKLTGDKIQFQFELSRYQGRPAQTIIWMSCYQACPQVKVGEQWRLWATLKKPKLNTLPGEMNPKYWLMSNHIEWLGMVNSGGAVRLSAPEGMWLFQAFRAHLAETLAAVLKQDPTLGLIQGLTLGVASNIDKAQWDLFRRTGTTHLVVISGEHIGLTAGFFFIISRFIWSKCPRFALYFPAQQAASVMAWSVGCFYAFLSGLGAPVERALIGFGVLLLRYFFSVRLTIWQAWRYALLMILCIEPHVVVAPGFYLSFIAVGILVLISARFPAKRLRLAVQLQLACLLGLTPLTLYAFSYASLNGFVVNLIAIPLVGLVIVPASLIGLVLIQIYPWSGWLWVAKCFSGLFLGLLHYLDEFAWMNLTIEIANLSALISISMGLGALCLMPIRSLSLVSICLVMLPFFPKKLTLKPAEAKMTVFDVGQGFSVLIQTAHHNLLYDTGGAFYKGGDLADFKILPYLNHLHIKTINGLVISHQDLDHRGGLSTIEKAYPIEHFWVNEPSFYHRGLSCHESSPWEWDGVKFKFFPLPTSLEKRNNTCCILQIESKQGSILFTGDIEAKAEAYLVAHYGQALHSDYLFVPHHGSQTSSSMAFLKAVNPKMGIISSGLNNRYHFPHRQTLNTYQQLHIPLQNTAELGSIQIELLDHS
jgi:competence protein ComEC